MLTKSNINVDDFRNISAEHESALSKIRETVEAEEKQKAWLKKREKKFTSSNCHKLMTYEDKPDEFPKGAMTYVEEVVIEILTDGQGKESYYNDDMERGNDKELENIARFELETGIKCFATGSDQEFVELCSYFGGTPDGLFDDDGLIEAKCPKSKTHLFYLRNLKTAADLKKHCANYYWQMQGNFLATGRKTGYFISYDERFTNPEHQIVILKVDRNDEDIAKLKKRLQMAENHKKQLLNFAA